MVAGVLGGFEAHYNNNNNNIDSVVNLNTVCASVVSHEIIRLFSDYCSCLLKLPGENGSRDLNLLGEEDEGVLGGDEVEKDEFGILVGEEDMFLMEFDDDDEEAEGSAKSSSPSSME